MTASSIPPVDPGRAPFVLRLFGPFEASLNGEPLPPTRTRKSQWALALLALRSGSTVDRAWLAGTLWPESPPEQTLATLRRALTDLRHSLGEESWRLRSPTSHRTLCLDLTGAFVDLIQFDAAVARGDPASLAAAVALYRGPLLEGCLEAWALPERQAREQAYLTALEALADQTWSKGDRAATEEYLRRAVAADPLRESSQRRLMRLLAQGGNYPAALLTYRELRLRLHEELRAEPDPETNALFHELRAGARSRGQAAPPVRTVGYIARQAGPLLSPTGEDTVTFLFTDIEGSVARWEQHPEAMRAALARHDTLLRHAFQAYGGHVFKTMGDQFCAAFPTVFGAIAAALTAQRALQAESWGETGPLRVRMAAHTGVAEEREGDYFGPPLNRVARLLDVAHGGQVLLSQATAELVRDDPPEGTNLQDLGEHRLKDLVRRERVFQLVTADLPGDFPPLNSLDARRNNLPVQPSPLIGRKRELAQAGSLLTRDDVRLLTLTGPGGAGKTRLAMQVAADRLDDFADGVFFVDLAPIRDPELLVATIAQALGVREIAGVPLLDSLKEYLRERQLLLLLDNFEQILEAAPRVAELLGTAPRLKMLVTSRALLRLRGEQEFRVPPLELPDLKHLPSVEALSQYAAVELFIQRALAARPDFSITNENAPAVAEICHRLDGLPLAIELAAARVKLFSPQALLSRLENRLGLLTGGARDLPERQQTLRATISWSHDLLDAMEQRLFRRLAVFVGGCTLEAAVVCGTGMSSPEPILDTVTSLVDQSLLQEEIEPTGEPRFRMLETIREFARECLAESGEEEALRRRHAEHFLVFAMEARAGLWTAEAGVWLDRLEQERDNLRAVLGWVVASAASPTGGEAAELGLRLGNALQLYWRTRRVTEGREWLERLLGPSADPGRSAALKRTEVRAKALFTAGSLACRQGDTQRAKQYLRESLSIGRELGDRYILAMALVDLGAVACYEGEYREARSLFEESLSIRRELGDRRRIAMTCNDLAVVMRELRDYDRAKALVEEALAIYRELGDDLQAVISLNNRGFLRILRGDYPGARADLQQGVAIGQKLGALGDLAIALGCLGRLARLEGDMEMSRARYVESIGLHRRQGNRCDLMGSLVGLACTSVAIGEQAVCSDEETESRRSTEWWTRGTRLFGTAEALCEAHGWHLFPTQQIDREPWVAAARAGLGETAFAVAWAKGRALSLEAACDLAMEVMPSD